MGGTPDTRYVEVVIDSAVRELDRPFHYGLPEEMRERVTYGSLVLVPFSGRPAIAFVTAFPESPGVGTVKDVLSVLDEPPAFDFDAIRLARWIASRYLSSFSQALRLFMPPGRSRRVRQVLSLEMRAGDAHELLDGRPTLEEERRAVDLMAAGGGEVELSKLVEDIGESAAGTAAETLVELGVASKRYALSRPAASEKRRLAVKLVRTADELEGEKLGAKQRAVIDLLLEGGGTFTLSEVLSAAGAPRSSIKSLEKKGIVEVTSEEVLRMPRLGSSSEVRPVPNEMQAAAVKEVSEAIDGRMSEVFLLDGVTGSGKTEVYLLSIERCLELGRTAIALVPEISLTPQTLERFSSRFPGQVAVLHSRLSPGERYDQWRGILEGRYSVVVGARSALFAPLKDLGLIVIDEEHESSYKNDTSPRYQAREVAEARARMSGCPLLLGSATPAFESLHRAKAGAYRLLRLPERVDSRPMPEVEIVDMRTEGGAGVVPLVSRQLLDALSRTVEAGDQAILFLNRRGFSNYLQCHACGSIIDCDSCEVSLCYHSRGHILMCHHCGVSRKVPDKCPSCGAPALKGFGAGTQKVEDEVARHLPGITSIRMDADTTRGKDAHWELIGAFKNREAQVLIGTQMIAKGHDIPGVTLVGVINADTALAIPDFRASERTYQLLTQVSGRAGRDLRPGRVVIQTFNPEHPAIRALTDGGVAFLDAEIKARQTALYPPFIRLVNVMVQSPDGAVAARAAQRLRKVFESELPRDVKILGPAPAPLSRLRDQYRWHVLLKCGDVSKAAPGIMRALGSYRDYSKSFPQGAAVRVTLDVDPVSLL